MTIGRNSSGEQPWSSQNRWEKHSGGSGSAPMRPRNGTGGVSRDLAEKSRFTSTGVHVRVTPGEPKG